MDKLLFAIMIGMLIFISYKNITLIKRYKHNKEYIESYRSVLEDTETAHNIISNYIETEKSLEYKNRAKIIKLYCELNKDLQYTETLNDIDLKPIYFNKGKYDNKLVNLNSDSFVFMILSIAKAFECGKNDVLDTLLEKLKEVPELERRLEYQEVIAFSNCLLNKDGIDFMKGMIDGSYTEFVYEKRMIGLYKRIATSTLAYKDEQLDEYFTNDLHKFSATKIGESILKSLGIYDKYLPLENDNGESDEDKVYDEVETKQDEEEK